MLVNRVTVQGFIILDYFGRFPEAIAQLGQWVAEGKVKDRHTIVEGLENAPEAVNMLFDGRQPREADRQGLGGTAVPQPTVPSESLMMRHHRLPPVRRAPGALNAVYFTRDPVGFLERQWRRYGDAFSINFPGFGRMAYFVEPETVKQIFTSDARAIHAGEANGRVLEPALGKFSLLTLDEDDHLRQRKLLLPAFHGERVRRYGELIADIAEREIDRWPLGSPLRAAPAHAVDHARSDPARRVRRPR